MDKPTAEERQAALNNISEADLAKIQAKTSSKIKVAIEDVIEAEFLMKFGWEAYWSLYPEKDRTKGISGKEMTRLIVASRKVDAQNMYKDAQTAFIGAVSAQTKKPSSAFDKATRKLLKSTEAEL